jgi:hypothetical protein
MLVKLQIRKLGTKNVKFKQGPRDVIQATALEVGDYPCLHFLEYQFTEEQTRQALTVKEGDIVTVHVQTLKAGFQAGTFQVQGPVIDWPKKS